MKTFLYSLLIMLLLTITVKAEEITITNQWIRALPPTAKATAAFMHIYNASNTDKILVKAYSPRFNIVELHKTEIVDGIAKMIEQKEIVIPAGQKVIFKPGDYHVMLIDPKTPFYENEEIAVTLVFKTGQEIGITAVVKKMPMEMMMGH